ncbi:LysM peptidoglycan-binding domain-containing protein [Priestia endophytica]|uniref:LysM peptidoglycan-binding domain-containing protein n=1 Tax=Priestia endophytica TaxID=135735 RepID=UPI000DCA42D3|nr:LysM peptidoglycan-binding domain-containing protein [Priestia endophytica]RAS82991.1 hypothetical protein A4R27_07540 [Priestia endophytica]
MKKLGVLLIVLFIGYVAYYDISVGTLKASSPQAVETAAVQKSEKQEYQTVVVQQGDTVLSIISQLQKEDSNLNIEKISQDFRRLNDNLSPENIQVGKKYKFPIYSSS